MINSLLPSRADIAELQKQVSIAEKAKQAAPSKKSAPTLTFHVKHIPKRVATGNEPYCEGSLSITGQHLTFDGQPAMGSSHTTWILVLVQAWRSRRTRASPVLANLVSTCAKGSDNQNFDPEDDCADIVVSALKKA